MTKKNIENLCRICVKESNSYMHIYDQCILDIRLYEIINDLCQLDIAENDGLPAYICRECHSKLLDFKKFKKTCHEGKVALISIKMKYGKASSNAEGFADWSEEQMAEENVQQLLEVHIKEEPVEGYGQESGVSALDDKVGSIGNNEGQQNSSNDPAGMEIGNPGSQVFIKSEPVDPSEEDVTGQTAANEPTNQDFRFQVFLKSEAFGADCDEAGEPSSAASPQDPGTLSPQVDGVSSSEVQFNPLSCMRARLQHIIRTSVASEEESSPLKQEDVEMEESLRRSEFANDSSLSCSSRFIVDEGGSSCDGFSSSSQTGLTPQEWSDYQKWSYGFTCSVQRLQTEVIGWTRSGRERQRVYETSRKANESPEQCEKRLERLRVYAARKRERETLSQHRKSTPCKVGRPPKKRIFNFQRPSTLHHSEKEGQGTVKGEEGPDISSDVIDESEQKSEITATRPERQAKTTCANKIHGLMTEFHKSQSQEYNNFKRIRLSNESAEERERRLERMRNRARIRRSKETDEQREVRLAQIRYQNNRRLSKESEEQRHERLENMRKAASLRNAKYPEHHRSQQLLNTQGEALLMCAEEPDEDRGQLLQNTCDAAMHRCVE